MQSKKTKPLLVKGNLFLYLCIPPNSSSEPLLQSADVAGRQSPDEQLGSRPGQEDTRMSDTVENNDDFLFVAVRENL